MARTTFNGPVNSVNGFEIDGSPILTIPVTTISPLTGITGTGNNAMTGASAATAASEDTTAASLTSVNAGFTEINADLKDLQAKVNAIIALVAP